MRVMLLSTEEYFRINPGNINIKMTMADNDRAQII